MTVAGHRRIMVKGLREREMMITGLTEKETVMEFQRDLVVVVIMARTSTAAIPIFINDDSPNLCQEVIGVIGKGIKASRCRSMREVEVGRRQQGREEDGVRREG